MLMFRRELRCPDPVNSRRVPHDGNFRKCHSTLSTDVSCICLAIGSTEQLIRPWPLPSHAPYAPSTQPPAISQDVHLRQLLRAHRHLLPRPIPSLLDTLPSPARLSQSLTPLSPVYQDSPTHLNHHLTSTITIPRLFSTAHLLRRCRTLLQSKVRQRKKQNSRLSRDSRGKSLGTCADSL